MCIAHRQLDPKIRRWMVAGNLSLIFGVLMLNSERWNWVHTSSQAELNWLNAITGFLFGLYIAIIVMNAIKMRRQHHCE